MISHDNRVGVPEFLVGCIGIDLRFVVDVRQ